MSVILLSDLKIAENASEIKEYFEKQVEKGLEGIMAKRLDGVYQAGARGWNWIKLKKSYSGKLSDTIDTVVMGYDLGQGKRTDFGIGDFLIGIYNEKKDMFVTLAKIGTGLTDEEWKQLKVRSQKFRLRRSAAEAVERKWQGYGRTSPKALPTARGQAKVKSKPKNYEVDKAMECDVWVAPEMVVEIRADEITRSPVHTAGRIMGPSKTGAAQEVKIPGFALRFPRLERFRDDKKPEDATTLSEIEKMYKMQGRK